VREARLSPLSDGARYNRVALAAQPDGSLRLTSHQMGASLEAAWGLDDQEVELLIAPDQVAVLALALAAAKLGRDRTVHDLVELCQEHGVDFRLACWT
jgi:hypothetical protein